MAPKPMAWVRAGARTLAAKVRMNYFLPVQISAFPDIRQQNAEQVSEVVDRGAVTTRRRVQMVCAVGSHAAHDDRITVANDLLVHIKNSMKTGSLQSGSLQSGFRI